MQNYHIIVNWQCDNQIESVLIHWESLNGTCAEQKIKNLSGKLHNWGRFNTETSLDGVFSIFHLGPGTFCGDNCHSCVWHKLRKYLWLENCLR